MRRDGGGGDDGDDEGRLGPRPLECTATAATTAKTNAGPGQPDPGGTGPPARIAPRRRSGRADRAPGGSGPGCAATEEVAATKAGPVQPGPERLQPGMRRDGGGGGDEGRAGP